MKYTKIFILFATLFALSSCIQISNENKAVNGSNDEGGNSYSQESYSYSNEEYSSSNTYHGSSSGSSSSTGSMSCYTGTIGSSAVTMYINPSVTSGKIGYYYYNKYQRNISLYVNDYDYDGDGTREFELVEETSGHGQTGYFRIAVYPSHYIHGTFVNSKGQSFEVSLN